MREKRAAFRAVGANPALRHVQLGWVGSMLGGWSYGVTIAVYAFEHGGASAVGLAALVRWLPAAAVAPWAAVLGDLLPRKRVMLSSDLGRIVVMSCMAGVAFAGGSSAIVYGLAACSAVVGTAFRPAQRALLPSLAQTPDELAAANVVSSLVESLGIFGGPAIGGLLLALTSPGTVFACVAGAFAWSALHVARLPQSPRPPAAPRGIASQTIEGIRTILTIGRVRLIVGMFALQTLVDGALTVLIVVLALRRLHLGDSGVGLLMAAGGIGGLLGGIGAAALVGRRHLAPAFGLSILFWGLPIALIGVWPAEWLALVLLAAVGAANTVADVAGETLLQRGVADEVLARVFGVLESVILACSALGAVLAPLAYRALGLRGALILIGTPLPVAALLAWRTLAATDVAAPVGLGRLRDVPFLAVLPPPTLELLAAHAALIHVSAGDNVFREGDPGDRFYVIDAGEVEIAGGRHGPGGYFGEIALVRDVPRTATVRAVTDVDLLALEREAFIAAVTGYPPSAEATDAVIEARMPALSG
jgi:predicted MFS family arabinose efflux permease